MNDVHQIKSVPVTVFCVGAVSGRQAAGRGSAGVRQQRVSDRRDVRGGPERPDSHQAQVQLTSTWRLLQRHP